MPGRHAAPATSSTTRAPRRVGVVALTATAAGASLASLTGVATADAATTTSPMKAVPTATTPTSKIGTPKTPQPPNVPGLGKGRTAAPKGSLIVAEARKHIGTPYKYGGDGPSSFDCSGLTKYVFAKVGITLPRSAAAQQDTVQPVSKAAMQPGDLIFLGNPAHHVAIYAGNGMMVTAPESGESVKMDNVPTTYTAGRAA